MNKIYTFALIVFIVLLGGCSSRSTRTYKNHTYSMPPKIYSANRNNYSPRMDNKTYSHPTMRPYVVRGVKYYPNVVSVGDEFRGNASWYGPKFHGKFTSNGERYNMWAMTAAHKTLPMNTIVKVTNRRNGRSTVVRINDRGPFVATRIIDLSKSAAKKIDMVGTGTAPVSIEILGFETKGRKKIPSAKELKRNPQKKSYGKFALQIASFANIKGALITQQKYDYKDGYRTIIKDVDNINGRVFKVWLKGFKSEQEARDYKNEGHFKDAFIVGEN